MKQDLQLTFLDILGYILPGGLVVYVMILTLTDRKIESATLYTLIILGGYFMGHILFLFERLMLSRLSDLICGDRQQAPIKYNNKRLTNFATKFLGLPYVNTEVSEQIIKILTGSTTTSTILDYYLYKISDSQTLYNHERRLRAFTILFANMSIAILFVIFLPIESIKQVDIVFFSIFLSLLSVLNYCRYRIYRINFLYTNGYYKDRQGEKIYEYEERQPTTPATCPSS